MLKMQLILLFILFSCGEARAYDEFKGVQCGSDIRAALLGKTSSNERVVVIESLHKDLGLKDLGGSEVSDHLFLESWLICGGEYEMLVDNKTQRILDVLSFPAHSPRMPMFIGECQRSGVKAPDAILAVLNNSAGYSVRDRSHAKTLLKATVAWEIDESRMRFIALKTENLNCPLEGIITADGGL